MKKFIFFIILVYSVSFLHSSVVEAKRLTLTDQVLHSLSDADFLKAYEIAIANENYDRMTLNERDQLFIQIYNNLANKKPRAKYLPASYNSLNSKEKSLAKKHPAQAAIVYAASDLATKRANALYKNGLHNGNGDAFRHAYWNAEMATMLAGMPNFRASNGRKAAKIWADAHENGASNQPKLEKEMDFHNNDVGRNIVTKKMSSKDLEKEILKKVNNGTCRRISGKKLVKTDKKK